MEFTPFIPQRAPTGTFGLAGTELAEILGCFGHGVGEEVHFYTAEGFACFVVEG